MTVYSIKNTKLFLALILIVYIFISIIPLVNTKLRIQPIIKQNDNIIKEERKILAVKKTSITLLQIEHQLLESPFNRDVTTLNAKRNELIKELRDNKILNGVNQLEQRIIAFDSFYKVIRLIGVENAGKIGDFRKSIHDFEDKIKSRTPVYVKLLELRRAEKDFLLRNIYSYKNKHLIIVKELKSLISNKAEKELLESYASTFYEVTNLIYEKKDFEKNYHEKVFDFDSFLEELFVSEISKSQNLSINIENNQTTLFTFNLLTTLIIGIFIFYIFKFTHLQNKTNEQTLERLGSELERKERLQENLISQEKLASLGSLAAGIAHEIKNPLNIIINSTKILIEVIEDNVSRFNDNQGDLDMIKKSSELIITHGQRADGIVKNMLSLARGTSEEKVTIDLNQLILENYQLVYHTMRSNNPFDITFINNLSPISPFECKNSEIARAFINIFDNSIYAMRAKLKSNNYTPTLLIKSHEIDGQVEIRIRDNGIGISQKDLEKILEPFYTTKPTGEGTGLGLSFTYDVIKSHNGIIDIISEEGKYTEIRIVFTRENI